MRSDDTPWAQLRLTPEQVRNLPTVPVEVIPAPGDGYRIVIEDGNVVGGWIRYHIDLVKANGAK